MQNKIKILIIQNNAILGNKIANFDVVSSLVEPYKSEEVDLIVLPEVWAVGWYCSLFPECAEEGCDSPTLNFLRNLALDFNSNVAGGSYIRKTPDGKLRNTCPVFDRKGNLLANYDKMHLFTHCGAGEGNYIEKGEQPVLVNTDIGKIGLTICYDIRFAPLFRTYALNGADLLINMAAWPKSRKNHWITLQKARAIENQSFMISVSQTGKITNDEYNLGHSMVISPLGEIISTLHEEESVLIQEIDLSEMKSLRVYIPTLKDIHTNYEGVKIV